MTKTEKYIALRSSGMTYEAIANKYGISRQAVHSAIRKHNTRAINVKPQTVVFTGLRNWMNDNHIFVSDLERMTGEHLRQALRSGKINIQSISTILKVTGLTYEQAFSQQQKEEL